MALYKSWMNAIVRHSRSFSYVVPGKKPALSKELKYNPEIMRFLGQPSLDKKQWAIFEEEVKENNSTDRAVSLPFATIQLCVAQKNYNLGKSYMKYLRDNGTELDAAIIGQYLYLLYSGRESITEDDKEEILSMYSQLRLKYPLLDGVTAELCILAISLTEKWRETEEVLEILEISCDTASTRCYSAIIAAAFNNGDPEMGWKYFNKSINLTKKPTTEAYVTYIDYCLNTVKETDACINEIEKLFNFFAKHQILPDRIFMEHIKKTFENFGWVGAFTTIRSTGTCQHCHNELPPINIAKEDFLRLSKAVHDKVIVGKDVYNKTTPFELDKFLKVVNRSKPYDVVIDGLNVCYTSKRHGSVSAAANQLATLVRHFLDANKVVMVLGRKHMLNWDQTAINYIKKNSFLFLTNNLSADDPYLLYATLASGPKTIFVSNDFMRQHKFILKDKKLEETFKLWQISHQCSISFEKGKLTYTPAISYSPIAQKSDNSWHIPCRLSQSSSTGSYEPPKDWLCLKSPDPNRDQ